MSKANNFTAFGEPIAVSLTPKIQLQFPYNVNDRLVKNVSTGSGTISWANGMIEAHSGAATSSKGAWESIAVAKYNTGQGILVRFTAIFDTHKTGNNQYIGIGNTEDGYFIGYHGTEFGVCRARGGVEYWTPQSEWNYKMSSPNARRMELNPQKLNVYQIRYQWLGGGHRYNFF